MEEFVQNGLKIFKNFRRSQQSTMWPIRDPATVYFFRESWPTVDFKKKSNDCRQLVNFQKKSHNSRFIVKSRLSTSRLAADDNFTWVANIYVEVAPHCPVAVGLQGDIIKYYLCIEFRFSSSHFNSKFRKTEGLYVYVCVLPIIMILQLAMCGDAMLQLCS
jgi:hypothetical protein